MKDKIVEEVRRIRLKIEQEYGHSTKKYLEHIYTEQKKLSHKLVHRQPKLLKKHRAM